MYLNVKKIFYTILIVIVCLVGLIKGKDLYDEYRDYSSNEILGFENGKLSSENTSVAIRTTDQTPKRENPLPTASDILISKEIEQELINSFKNATFKEYNGATFKYQYYVSFTVDSVSSFWLNIDDGVVYVNHNTKNYVFEEDNNFLNIFKEAVK